MHPIHLLWIDYTILAAYVLFVLGIGWALARYMKTSADFFRASARSIPTWVTGLAFISANLGALELVGMMLKRAEVRYCHRPLLLGGRHPRHDLLLAVFMMPFYYGSKARSVPEYLKMRFDERVRALNSVAFAVMTIFCLRHFHECTGQTADESAALAIFCMHLGFVHLQEVTTFTYGFVPGVVLLYVLKGGLTSAIYTEVLPVLHDRAWFCPSGLFGFERRWRLACNESRAANRRRESRRTLP